MGSIFTNRSVLKVGSVINTWLLKHLGVMLQRAKMYKLIFCKTFYYRFFKYTHVKNTLVPLSCRGKDVKTLFSKQAGAS
jgi:hypothetical protein